MIGLAAASLAAAVAGQPAETEARRIARETLDRLLAADEAPDHGRDRQGRDRVLIRTPPRASDEAGLCRHDRLAVVRAPLAGGGGRILGAETEAWFLVLFDARHRPLWELDGEALERACAAAGPARGDRWFPAPDAELARAAAIGLEGLGEALLRPGAPGVEWACGAPCPAPAALAAKIEPLVPPPIGDGHSSTCPIDAWCVTAFVPDSECGAWTVQLRLTGASRPRYRSARIGWPVGRHACIDPEG